MSQQPHKPQIPGFEIVEKIGEGGMANVYKARQTRQDRIVAVKVLKHGFSEDGSSAEEERDQFRTEAQAAARISHPNIVQVIDFDDHDGQTYIVMEYVPGCTIAELLELRRSLNEKDANAICTELAYALDYCWNQHKMIHCDIKPDNVIVHTDGTIKLADLGLARVKGFNNESNADADFVMGTPNYMSPEQALDEVELDCRADIYSLGATLYHMLTGEVPFGDHPPEVVVQKQLDEQIPDPWSINQTIPPSFIWVIEKMLAKDRDQRQQTWKEVAADLDTALRGYLIEGAIETTDGSTVARHADRPKPEKPKKRIQPKTDAAKPNSLAQDANPKRKVLISDEDKRLIHRQHDLHLNKDNNRDFSRAFLYLGTAAALAALLYAWSILQNRQSDPSTFSSVFPRPAPIIQPQQSPELTIAPIYDDAAQQANIAKVRADVEASVRKRKAGPPPPRPKSPPPNTSTSTARTEPLIPTGPIPLRRPGNNPQTTTTQTPAPTSFVPPPNNGSTDPASWDSPAYKAARLKIIDSRKAFYFYVQNRGEKGRLKKIEQDAREAIAELKQVEAVAPEGANIERHITSGYKLIADCHAATQL